MRTVLVASGRAIGGGLRAGAGQKNGHQTKLSFQVVVFAAAQQTLTACECRRDTVGAKSEKTPVIRRGESKTVSLARRPRLVPKGRALKGHELLRVFSR